MLALLLAWPKIQNRFCADIERPVPLRLSILWQLLKLSSAQMHQCYHDISDPLGEWMKESFHTNLKHYYTILITIFGST